MRNCSFFSVIHGKAADILHTVPAEATYEDIVESLRDRFGDHQLAAAYRSQLNARVQESGETLQEFTAAGSSWHTEPWLDFLSPLFKRSLPTLSSTVYETGR